MTGDECLLRRRKRGAAGKTRAEETRPLKRIRAEIPVRSTAEKVFRAWTDSAELSQWFSEHADVRLDERRYCFWGRYQPDAPLQPVGQQLSVIEPDRRLRFDWRVRGVETTVDVTLERLDEVTLVTVEHEWLPGGDADILEAFWSLSAENLRGWVERGVAGERCDFSVRPTEDVRLEIDIDAEPEAVFEALIDPAQLERYIASSAIVEPHIGGRYHYGWAAHTPMKILELEPPHKLSHTWNYEGDDHARDTIVTWNLEGSGGKTRLTIVHSGFTPDRGSDDYQIGWLDFLNRIKFMVEGGPSWKRPNVYGAHRKNVPV